MVGRDLDALFPKQVAEVGADRAQGRPADARGRVHRRLLRGPGRRDRRARRSRRRRPPRGGARDLRHRPRRRRRTSRCTAAGCPPASPNAAMRAGIGFVPEDRRQQGLVMPISIERNMALASLERLQRFLLIPRRAERRFASEWATRLQLRYGRLSDPASSLSGGNQQKVVLAKWLARQPTLLIVDEPTRGIDVGTKAEVHRLLSDLAERGRRDPDDLERAARGARHGRSRARAVRGPRVRRVRAQRGRRGSRSCARPRASPARRRHERRRRTGRGRSARARTAWPRRSSASASSASCSRCSS